MEESELCTVQLMGNECCKRVLKCIGMACDQDALAMAGGWIFGCVKEQTNHVRELKIDNDILNRNCDHLRSENVELSRRVKDMELRIESLVGELAKLK